MFIFNRPVSAVAAALAVALLTVCIDNACQSRLKSRIVLDQVAVCAPNHRSNDLGMRSC